MWYHLFLSSGMEEKWLRNVVKHLNLQYYHNYSPCKPHLNWNVIIWSQLGCPFFTFQTTEKLLINISDVAVYLFYSMSTTSCKTYQITYKIVGKTFYFHIISMVERQLHRCSSGAGNVSIIQEIGKNGYISIYYTCSTTSLKGNIISAQAVSIGTLLSYCHSVWDIWSCGKFIKASLFIFSRFLFISISTASYTSLLSAYPPLASHQEPNQTLGGSSVIGTPLFFSLY